MQFLKCMIVPNVFKYEMIVVNMSFVYYWKFALIHYCSLYVSR